MSCQQVTRIITREKINATTFMPEDPYVFTETTPATPPILFNNQKSRGNRLIETPNSNSQTPVRSTFPSTAAATATTAATTTCAANNTLVKSNRGSIPNGKKGPTPLGIQQQQQQQLTSKTFNKSPNENSISAQQQQPQQKQQISTRQQLQKQCTFIQNDCKARNSNFQNGIPKLQQQQQYQQQQQQSQQQQLQQTPSQPSQPSHTPSLWQTPLLLEQQPIIQKQTAGSINATSTATTSSNIFAPTSSVASLDTHHASFKAIPVPSSPAQYITTHNVVTTPVITPISMPTLSLNTIVEATPAMSASTTMIPLLLSSATPLPPSKFHNTTLAEHLQKLECIKKKKPNANQLQTQTQTQTQTQPQPQHPQQQQQQQTQQTQRPPIVTIQNLATTFVDLTGSSDEKVGDPDACIEVKNTTPVPTAVFTSSKQQPSAIQNNLTINSSSNNIEQHSIPDLNEIPVNVIFRSPPKSLNSSKLELKKEATVTATAIMQPNTLQCEKLSLSNNLNNLSVNFQNQIITNKNVKNPQQQAQQHQQQLQQQQQQNMPFAQLSPNNTNTNNNNNNTINNNINNQINMNNNNNNNNNGKMNELFVSKDQIENKPQKPSSKQTIKRKNEFNVPQLVISKKLTVATASTTRTASPPATPATPLTNTSSQTAKRCLKVNASFNRNEENICNNYNNEKHVQKNKNNHETKNNDDDVVQVIAVLQQPPPLLLTSSATIATAAIALSPKQNDKVKIDVEERRVECAVQKRSKKILPINFRSNHNICNKPLTIDWFLPSDIGCTGAVAVAEKADAELVTDMSSLADIKYLPYCSQKYWFDIVELKKFKPLTALNGNKKRKEIKDNSMITLCKTNWSREERIAENKNIFRRQALQLLSTNSLQRLPYHLSRRRLLCIDRLLRKYSHGMNKMDIAKDHCKVDKCNEIVLETAQYCQKHIINSTTQHLFLPCNAKCDNGIPCRTPVFDMHYNIQLCEEHQRLKNKFILENTAASATVANSASTLALANSGAVNAGRQTTRQTSSLGEKNVKTVTKSKTTTTATATAITNSKRKSGKFELPQIEMPNTIALLESPIKNSLKRKNSTTSLESIASNSHSSNSSLLPPPAQQQLLSYQHETLYSNSLAPPALAPLSNNSVFYNHNTDFANLIPSTAVSDATKQINQLVAQFAMNAAANNMNSNSSNNNYNVNSNMNKYSNNYNSNSNNMNLMFNTNSNSNLTSSGVGSTSSLPSTDELLTQDMICENSSAYASSEDTGLGELSESELMVAGGGGGGCGGGGGGGGLYDDVDEIPLGDTRLLEEHDLANVLSTLPADAFNELFTAVRQDECEEVDRALEIADKHLKTLQQTIGTDEADFFVDLLDVNDDMLSDTDICSKVSIADDNLDVSAAAAAASALYFDNACNSNNLNNGTMTNSICAPLATASALSTTPTAALADLQMLQT